MTLQFRSENKIRNKNKIRSENDGERFDASLDRAGNLIG
jgi:hypothetical protein